MIVFGHDEHFVRWVAEGIDGITEFSPPYVAFGSVVDGQIRSGAVFTDWNGSNIEVSIRANRLHPGFVKAMYKYAFVQLGAGRVTLKIKRSNKRVLKLAERFGFQYEATLKRYYGHHKRDDAIIYRLFNDSSFLVKG